MEKNPLSPLRKKVFFLQLRSNIWVTSGLRQLPLRSNPTAGHCPQSSTRVLAAMALHMGLTGVTRCIHIHQPMHQPSTHSPHSNFTSNPHFWHVPVKLICKKFLTSKGKRSYTAVWIYTVEWVECQKQLGKYSDKTKCEPFTAFSMKPCSDGHTVQAALMYRCKACAEEAVGQSYSVCPLQAGAAVIRARCWAEGLLWSQLSSQADNPNSSSFQKQRHQNHIHQITFQAKKDF